MERASMLHALSTRRTRPHKLPLRMKYRVRYAQGVVKQLEKMSPDVARRIRSQIGRLSNDLAGDVKRLTNFSPEYRLRVGRGGFAFTTGASCSTSMATWFRSNASATDPTPIERIQRC